MAYTHTLFADVVDALARRLYNPEKTQWVQTELEGLVKESLRTWNALSQFWRQEFDFTLATNTWWYDLRSVANSLVPCTVTQYDIITKIKQHLLEPPDPSTWGGSTQFTLSDVLDACHRRQDETFGVTGCTIGRSLLTASTSSVRTALPDGVIDLRRVTWLPTVTTTYSNKILAQSDAFASRAWNPFYTLGGARVPLKWMQNTEPPPSFDVDAKPPTAGQYEVLTTQAGSDWVPGTDAVVAGMPDDWSWVFTFGAMADLFSRESIAQDPLRSAYCRSRYQEGQALMRLMPVALALQLNGVPMAIGAVTGGDRFNPRWQAAAAGAPRACYEFMNLLAFTPKPDSGSAYTATVTVCRNIDVGATYVQVAKDDVDTIIDYAQHLAMLKQGGQEFYQSIALYQAMQRKAALYNGKLVEMGFFEMTQLDFSGLEEKSRNPRYQKGTEPQG